VTILTDEFDREYKRLQRPAAAVAKTDQTTCATVLWPTISRWRAYLKI